MKSDGWLGLRSPKKSEIFEILLFLKGNLKNPTRYLFDHLDTEVVLTITLLEESLSKRIVERLRKKRGLSDVESQKRCPNKRVYKHNPPVVHSMKPLKAKTQGLKSIINLTVLQHYSTAHLSASVLSSRVDGVEKFQLEKKKKAKRRKTDFQFCMVPHLLVLFKKKQIKVNVGKCIRAMKVLTDLGSH